MRIEAEILPFERYLILKISQLKFLCFFLFWQATNTRGGGGGEGGLKDHNYLWNNNIGLPWNTNNA